MTISFKINDNYFLKLSYSNTLSDWWWYLVRKRGDGKEIIFASGELDDCKNAGDVPLVRAKTEAHIVLHDLAYELRQLT